MTVHRIKKISCFITADELSRALQIMHGDEYVVEGKCVRCGKESPLRYYKTKLGTMKLCEECVKELESQSAHLSFKKWEESLDAVNKAVADSWSNGYDMKWDE